MCLIRDSDATFLATSSVVLKIPRELVRESSLEEVDEDMSQFVRCVCSAIYLVGLEARCIIRFVHRSNPCGKTSSFFQSLPPNNEVLQPEASHTIPVTCSSDQRWTGRRHFHRQQQQQQRIAEISDRGDTRSPSSLQALTECAIWDMGILGRDSNHLHKLLRKTRSTSGSKGSTVRAHDCEPWRGRRSTRKTTGWAKISRVSPAPDRVSSRPSCCAVQKRKQKAYSSSSNNNRVQGYFIQAR